MNRTFATHTLRIQHIPIVAFLIMPCILRAQVGPVNADEFNAEIRFNRSFGTIGSDGPGNLPDPSWLLRIANDVDNMPNDLIDNSPNVVTGAFNYWLTTDVNDWHPVQDVFLDKLFQNKTGNFDYEVMSYENDCTNLSVYNVGGSCGDDDDNMLYKEGIVQFSDKFTGEWYITEIDLDTTMDFSKVELKYIWRHSNGRRDIPLRFDNINTGVGYAHTNASTNNGFFVDVKYKNDWTDVASR